MTRKPGKHIVPVTWYCRKLSLLGALPASTSAFPHCLYHNSLPAQGVVGAVTKHPSILLCICMFRNNFSSFVMSCDLRKTTSKRNGWQTGAWNCNNMDTCVKRVAILMVFTSVVLFQGAYRKLSLPLVHCFIYNRRLACTCPRALLATPLWL